MIYTASTDDAGGTVPTLKELRRAEFDGPIEAQISHRGGVWWHEAPVPPRRHNCYAQTSGWAGQFGLTQIWRCPCGAHAYASRHPIWDDRNSRAGGKESPEPEAQRDGRDNGLRLTYGLWATSVACWLVVALSAHYGWGPLMPLFGFNATFVGLLALKEARAVGEHNEWMRQAEEHDTERSAA